MEVNSAKKPIKFHNPPKKGEVVPTIFGPVLRGVFYLVLLGGVTYIAKFSAPEPHIVRTHSLVSWTFPTAHGHSLLFVSPDDNNDSNFTRTGHRIWIDPPIKPSEILANSARFAGPKMTVFARTIKESTVEELILSIDSGGSIQIWLEEPQKEIDQYQGIWQGREVQVFKLSHSKPVLFLSLSETERLEVHYTSVGRTIFLNSQGYHIIHHFGQQAPTLNPEQGVSLLYWIGAQNDALVEQWNTMNPHITSVLGLQKKPSFEWNQNKIPLFEPDHAALFYQEIDKIKIKKIKLQLWDRTKQ